MYRYYIVFIPICLIALISSYFLKDPYYIIVGVNSLIGNLFNYVIPILICVKFLDEKRSIWVISIISISYLLYCTSLSSGFSNFTKLLDW